MINSMCGILDREGFHRLLVVRKVPQVRQLQYEE
jgi:hypothetical protein